MRGSNINMLLWIMVGILFLILIFYSFRRENYSVAKDPISQEMFDKLTNDLSQLYPDIKNLDLKGLVSCVPEDSYTENKRHVSICLRNKEGTFYPYEKLLKIGIHELAHVISKGYDPEHKTPEFINNYAMLMKKARELGYKVE